MGPSPSRSFKKVILLSDPGFLGCGFGSHRVIQELGGVVPLCGCGVFVFCSVGTPWTCCSNLAAQLSWNFCPSETFRFTPPRCLEGRCFGETFLLHSLKLTAKNPWKWMAERCHFLLGYVGFRKGKCISFSFKTVWRNQRFQRPSQLQGASKICPPNLTKNRACRPELSKIACTNLTSPEITFLLSVAS